MNKINKITQMLEDFSKSYVEKTNEIEETTIGFLSEDQWWTISIRADHSYLVVLEKPNVPAFYITAPIETLEAIYTKKMHFLTAAGRAKMSDPTPLNFGFLHGYQPKSLNALLEFGFHFFVMGKPEMIYYGKEYARIVHGGYAIPLLYAPGIRSGWYRVEGDMIINEKPEDQRNPFNTLVIATKGKGTIVLDQVEYDFEEGMTYYIPNNMSHSFYSKDERGLEFIILMYGEGA